MMKLRIGDVLVHNGVMTPQQVADVLSEQQRSGGAFGVLSERMFNINPRDVEMAWSQQYASLASPFNPDIEAIDPACLELVTRRQAWQFCVLAVRFDESDLVLVSAQQHLPRALRFSHYVLDIPSYLVCADPLKLGQALCRNYPMAGLTPEHVMQERPLFQPATKADSSTCMHAISSPDC